LEKISNFLWFLVALIYFGLGYRFQISKNGMLRFVMLSLFYVVAITTFLRGTMNYFIENEFVKTLILTIPLIIVGLTGLVYLWRK